MSGADPRLYPDRPFLGVSSAVFRGTEVLLVKRGKPPYRDVWSLPGGVVEAGERLAAAAAREVVEETAIDAAIGRLVDFHEIIIRDDKGKAQRHFVLAVFRGDWRAGDVHAGDDAAEARFFPLDMLASLALTEGTEALVRRAFVSGE